MDDERCPKCGAVFPADRAWAKRTDTMLVIAPALQDLDTRVRCPGCGNVFSAREYRFFGFVRPQALKIGLGLFAVLMLAAGVYFLFIDAP
jgi:uncharacterized C2H2 Zn-finger protein